MVSNLESIKTKRVRGVVEIPDKETKESEAFVKKYIGP